MLQTRTQYVFKSDKMITKTKRDLKLQILEFEYKMRIKHNLIGSFGENKKRF